MNEVGGEVGVIVSVIVCAWRGSAVEVSNTDFGGVETGPHETSRENRIGIAI